MPKTWTDKDERMYGHILDSCMARRSGKSKTKTCKRIAAATVNKTRSERGAGRTMAGLKGGGTRARKRAKKASRTTIETLKDRAERCGSHWFEPGAMRFFNTRLSRKVYPAKKGKCVFFVSSDSPDRFAGSGSRRYSVRKMCGCNVSTHGEFMKYASSKSAHAAAKKAAEKA